MKLGFTQGNVGLARGKLFGTNFSQTIFIFEPLELGLKNMSKLKLLHQKWHNDQSRSSEQPSNDIGRCRKKKTDSLEISFRESVHSEPKADIERNFNFGEQAFKVSLPEDENIVETFFKRLLRFCGLECGSYLTSVESYYANREL